MIDVAALWAAIRAVLGWRREQQRALADGRTAAATADRAETEAVVARAGAVDQLVALSDRLAERVRVQAEEIQRLHDALTAAERETARLTTLVADLRARISRLSAAGHSTVTDAADPLAETPPPAPDVTR